MFLFRLIVMIVLLILITGCGDETSSPTTETVKLSTFWPKLDGCIVCHSPNGQEADGPDMSTPALFVKNLVEKKQSDYPNWYITSDCSKSLPFITSEDANKSTLMAALTEEDSDVMQKNNNCKSSFNIHDVNHASIEYGGELYNTLIAWINAGAINN